jgi:hypothetical protein
LNDNTIPIAAASLGQVYKLKLKDGSVKMVAVKVQVLINQMILNLLSSTVYAQSI